MSTLAFGIPGGPEWLIILAVVVLIFGARKLPELARAMGSSITQFKQGLKEEPPSLEDKSSSKAGEEGSEDGRKDEA